MQIRILSLCIVISAIAITLFFIPKNNTCKNFNSYFTMYFSSDCYYHPDLDDDIFGVIQRHVGIHEVHQFQTEDGYILEVIRIPRKNPKGVVLFQHPMYHDARVWVSQYNESIAFLFWRAGYDVWLGNTRGGLFGRRHVRLDPANLNFWNFSFHEMGYYDNSAIVQFIKTQVNESKIIYMGFSMGATTGLIYASTRSEEVAESVKVIVSLAAAPNLHHGKTVLTFLVPFIFRVQSILENVIDIRLTILKYDTWLSILSRKMWTIFPCKKCLVYVLAQFYGWHPNLDPELINMMMWAHGSETPLKVLGHFSQIYVSGGRFQMYDHGREENLKTYGHTKARLYPVENIKVPVFLVYGENDNLITSEDTEIFYEMLPKNSTVYGKIMVSGFTHIDFTHGLHRNEMVYEKILELLDGIL